MLLFDRLCAADAVPPQKQTCVVEGPRASLQRELLRLLNTRNGLSRAQFLACEGSVLHYGLPDLLGLCSQSDADLQGVSQLVEHAIRLFEPRLSDVRVQAWRDPADAVHARHRLQVPLRVPARRGRGRIRSVRSCPKRTEARGSRGEDHGALWLSCGGAERRVALVVRDASFARSSP